MKAKNDPQLKKDNFHKTAATVNAFAENQKIIDKRFDDTRNPRILE